MDINVTKDKDKEKVPEEFVGVAEGGMSIPRPGERSLKRRRRARSESSPEEVIEELVEEWRGEAIWTIDEIKGYTARNFAPKHEAYFAPRFQKLLDVFKRMEGEYFKANRMAQRVHHVEKALRALVEGEWGKEMVESIAEEVREIGVRMVREVRQECGQALERVKSEIGVALDTMASQVADRQKETDKVVGVVNEGL